MKTDKIAVSRNLIAGPRFYEQECRTLREINADLLAALEGAENVIAKALTFLPADGLSVHAGEWLGEIRATIARARGQE